MQSDLVRASRLYDFQTNVSHDLVAMNIKHSSKRDLPWLEQLPKTDTPCLLVAGGPSLTRDIETIRQRQREGHYVVALNGVAQYLRSCGITPDALVIVDARPEVNIAFAKHDPAKRYFIASQCAPEIFDLLSGKQVTLFHLDIADIGAIVPGDRPIQAIGGGATVGLISMSLAYTLGFRDLHLYGYDSSYSDKKHHAYTQTSNDKDDVVEAVVMGRRFYAAPWMVNQAEQFQGLLQRLVYLDCSVTTHGSGLLPWVAWNIVHAVPESVSIH